MQFVRAGDIADPAAMEEMVARAVAHFGRVDILINNAGINDGGRSQLYHD